MTTSETADTRTADRPSRVDVPRSTRLNLRTTPREDALIRTAAEMADKSVTDFVLDSATDAAENIVADRRWFELSQVRWDEFSELLDRPVTAKPRLAALLAEPGVFVD